jgi:hypothetical protein
MKTILVAICSIIFVANANAQSTDLRQQEINQNTTKDLETRPNIIYSNDAANRDATLDQISKESDVIYNNNNSGTTNGGNNDQGESPKTVDPEKKD